jgi:magnesium transporter
MALSRKRRRKHQFQRQTQPGASPGTIVVDPQSPKPIITVIAYSADGMIEEQIADIDQIAEYLKKWPIAWINIDGLGDAETIRRIGEIFNLHRLALEDVVNVHQRAKVEQYGAHLFIVARMVAWADRLETEQLSIFLGQKWVLTFQERPGGDSFDPVRARLRESRGRIRDVGADYLAYALLDAVVDAYFPVLEQYGEALEDTEQEVLRGSAQEIIQRIHAIKHDLLILRRAIWPMREAVHTLVRDPHPVIHDETRIYLRDCYDHTIQLIDLLETYRELGSDLRDLYLSSASNRMNEIMKVLTVISTIFIPLNFIAGVYGMNFNTEHPWNMPELNWRFGYMYALSLMLTVTAGLIYFFWQKGWLWPPHRARRPINESGTPGTPLRAESRATPRT